MRKYLYLLVQIAVSAVLVFFVSRNIHFGGLPEVIETVKAEYLVLALIVFIPAWLVGIFKWRFLVRTIIAEPLPFRFFASYYLIGYFYSLFVPGGQILGEGVKAWRISGKSEFKHQLYLSVFADKVTGFIALGFLILAAFLTQPALRSDSLSLGALVLGLAIAVIGIVLFFSPFLMSFIFNVLDHFLKFFPRAVGEHFSELKYHLSEYHKNRRRTLASVLIGALAHLSWSLTLYLIVLSFGVKAPFLFFVWTFLVMAVATFLPISYAGLGIREGTFVYFFSLLDVPRETAIGVALVLFGFQALAATTGGMLELKELWKK